MCSHASQEYLRIFLDRDPIRAREKHYSLVWYMLMEEYSPTCEANPTGEKHTFKYGVRKWTKLPIPFRGVAAPLRGANHITVSSFLFRRGVVFSFRRFYFVVASCFRFVMFLFRRGVVFSFRHVFVSSWGLVWFRRGVALDKSGLRF